MLVTLLVIAGAAALAALAVTFYRYCYGTGDRSPVVQRLLVRREQQQAEARMQRVMQDSLTELFKNVRDQR